MIYIAFEGIDGCGKSTQYKMQVERLRGIQGDEIVKEYAYSSKDNPVGRLIRKAYSQNSTNPLSFLTSKRFVQEGLYALNARQNLKGVPNLKEGILLSDRSVVTAYASHLELLPQWYISMAEPSLVPDLTIFIDVVPEVGYERISGRDELFLDENLDGLRIFHRNYKTILNGRRPKQLRDTQIEVINGNRSIEEIASDVTAVIDPFIQKAEKGGNNGK